MENQILTTYFIPSPKASLKEIILLYKQIILQELIQVTKITHLIIELFI